MSGEQATCSPAETVLDGATEMRTKLEGNLLAVHDRMMERGLDKQFEFRYSFRIPSEANRQSMAVSELIQPLIKRAMNEEVTVP